MPLGNIDWDKALEEIQGRTPYEKYLERIDELQERFERGVTREAEIPKPEGEDATG